MKSKSATAKEQKVKQKQGKRWNREERKQRGREHDMVRHTGKGKKQKVRRKEKKEER